MHLDLTDEELEFLEREVFKINKRYGLRDRMIIESIRDKIKNPSRVLDDITLKDTEDDTLWTISFIDVYFPGLSKQGVRLEGCNQFGETFDLGTLVITNGKANIIEW